MNVTRAFGVGLVVSFLTWHPGMADVRLPTVIGSRMVLQRDIALPVWGWADPGEEVTVTLVEHSERATADQEGRWKVTLPKMPAGGPHEMTVQGKNTLKLEDILVGEVWLCSGQSNMEWSVSATINSKEEIDAAKFPKICLFHVPKVPAGEPKSDVQAEWKACSPQTAGGFSAVGYFFGRNLREQLGVPIGLINSSWGGTRIEPWTPPEGFAAVPSLENIPKHLADADKNFGAALRAFLDSVQKKAEEHMPKKKTKEEELEAEDEGEKDDAGLPAPEDPELPNAKRMQQWLPLARKAVEEGKTMPELPGGWPRGWPAAPTHPKANAGAPMGLYNGMIHPLAPFALRGAIWYQGESNRGQGMFYHELMKGLIFGWRKVWNQGDFPFYYVQLAPYRYGGDALALAEIWEAQVATLAVPNTGMAVIVDIGNVGDIHPRNKQEVGRRLSLWALAKTYGKTDLVYSGPLYKSMKVENGKILVEFDHVGGGLVSRDGKALSHFAISGDDRKFVPAVAAIDGNSVVVHAEGLANPVAVRFAWHEEAEPNLSNQDGLPASPFRTDRWERTK